MGEKPVRKTSLFCTTENRKMFFASDGRSSLFNSNLNGNFAARWTSLPVGSTGSHHVLWNTVELFLDGLKLMFHPKQKTFSLFFHSLNHFICRSPWFWGLSAQKCRKSPILQTQTWTLHNDETQLSFAWWLKIHISSTTRSLFSLSSAVWVISYAASLVFVLFFFLWFQSSISNLGLSAQKQRKFPILCQWYPLHQWNLRICLCDESLQKAFEQEAGKIPRIESEKSLEERDCHNEQDQHLRFAQKIFAHTFIDSFFKFLWWVACGVQCRSHLMVHLHGMKSTGTHQNDPCNQQFERSTNKQSFMLNKPEQASDPLTNKTLVFRWKETVTLKPFSVCKSPRWPSDWQHSGVTIMVESFAGQKGLQMVTLPSQGSITTESKGTCLKLDFLIGKSTEVLLRGFFWIETQLLRKKTKTLKSTDAVCNGSQLVESQQTSLHKDHHCWNS